MKMRTSGGNCAPIDKQRSCSRSLVFASFSGSESISSYSVRLETRMVIKRNAEVDLGRSCPNNLWFIEASLCLVLLHGYLFCAALFSLADPQWFVGILSPTGFYIQGLNYETFFSLPLVCVCTHKMCRMTVCYIYLVRQGKERRGSVEKFWMVRVWG